RYVKPHGALYHRVIDDAEQAGALLAGSGTLPLLGMPGALFRLAVEAGRAVWHEGFPDRAYDDAGRLVPRHRPGAVLDDRERIAAQALALAPRVDSLCVHGDEPDAVAHAHAVRRALEAAGWALQGLD
ncbi:MAG: LamB/YcsF family protein, partial [Nocardioides sp.]|nr:LamB/YcsF family protein [Nocardioides sp.]